MEDLTENENDVPTVTLIKEAKRICQVLEMKEVESLFISLDLKDETYHFSGSSIGLEFIQRLLLIEKFHKFCKDEYTARGLSVSWIEKVKNNCIEQTEEIKKDVSDAVDKDDSYDDDSVSLKLEDEDVSICNKQNIKELAKQRKRERENEIKMRFPITPRITRSESRIQKMSLRSNNTKTTISKKTTIRDIDEKSTTSRKSNGMDGKNTQNPNKKGKMNKETEHDRQKSGGVNKIEIKDKKRENDREKMEEGQSKMEMKDMKESDRQMVEMDNADRETDKENKMEVSVHMQDVKCKWKTKKGYVCKICNEEFDKYSDFQDHVRNLKHLQDQNLKCNVCDMLFINMRSLGQHRNNLQHYLKCEICGKYFTRLKDFGRHQRIHKREKRNLEKKVACDELEKNFKCEICNESFSTTKGLGQHRYRYRHYHKCNECGKMFSRKKIFDIHCRRHENKPRTWKQRKSIPTEHQCNICGKIFSKNYPLRIHMRYHTGEKPYMCDLCGKVTASKTELNMHKLIHTDDRPYSCGICHKSFRILNKLKRHQIVHSGLKPHRCPDCGKGFTTASNMRTHVRNIHMGIKAFSCDICDIKFAHSSNMRSHMKGVHKKREHDESNSAKNEKVDLIKFKECDMNSNNSVTMVTLGKSIERKITNNNIEIQRKEYQNKEDIENKFENLNDGNVFNEINSNNRIVIQILPTDKHGIDLARHTTTSTINKGTVIQNYIGNKEPNQKAEVRKTSLREENENVKDMSEGRLYIDESSLSGQIKIHHEIEISNQTGTVNQQGDSAKTQIWCSQNNGKDLQEQEEIILKRQGVGVKSINVNKACVNQFQVKGEEIKRRDLSIQEGSSLQDHAPGRLENELNSQKFYISVQSQIQGSDNVGTGNDSESGREVIEVIQIQTQNLDADEIHLKPLEQMASGIEKGVGDGYSDTVTEINSQMQYDVESETHASESKFQPKEQIVEEKIGLHEQQQINNDVELHPQEEQLIDVVEFPAQELVIGGDLVQTIRQDGIVYQSQGHVINGIVIQTHEQVEDGIDLQDGGHHVEKSALQASGIDLQRSMKNVEEVEFQTTEQINDIEFQMEEEIVGDNVVQMHEEVIQIQEQTIDSEQAQKQTIDSVQIQKQTINNDCLQEQTIDNFQLQEQTTAVQEQTMDSLQKQTIEVQEQSVDTLQEQTIEMQEQCVDTLQEQTIEMQEQCVDSLQEQTVGSFQVQEQTIGIEQEDVGDIIQLNQDSEIVHVVYQPEYGDNSDNVPRLIYLYPTK